ncbi:MAG: chemotaxis protein CheX [Sedimentisphaerales bacterium]|nr:chemotaxis protein CheX [Sedimentisphaerales bacterium]
MNVKYINPFLSSIQNVFDTMINVPFQLGKPSLKQNSVPLYEISGIIGLSGGVTGCVVVSLSKHVALQMVSALTSEVATEIDDDSADAIGEITNMIAGNAKKDFPGENTSISIPSVVIGKHRVNYPKGVPIISIPCETSAGRLIIDVALKESLVPASVG